jgi:hypothetical protein
VHGTARLVTDGQAIMIRDQVPCTGIDITRSDRTAKTFRPSRHPRWGVNEP